MPFHRLGRSFGRALAALGLALPLLAQAATFAKGSDVSWVSQEESSGYTFYSSAGVKTDPFVLLKGLGNNAIRLRVWVSPSGGWCDGADVLYKAKRAAAQGQRIMIDFHYSDSWADPSHQTKPSAWSSHSYSQLKTDVYEHTYGILSYLKSNGITVEWVQVGNEINSGMLWPTGSYSNPSQLAGLINSGYSAVKAAYPSALVVLHLSNGYDNSLFRWFFDLVKNNGAKWDVIGMSHYPPASSWSSYDANLLTNMKDMVSRYGKPVIISGVGMDWQQSATAKSMMSDVMAKVKSLGSNGLGMFYWEPQAYPGWQGYTWGALNNSGQFTEALAPYAN
jgi:arabinogalactan endo-1,4-beta-galactosidase